MQNELIAGRWIGEVYRVTGRSDLHAFLIAAVENAGGRVLFASPDNRAPIYLGIQLDSDERMGILVYPFRVTRNTIRNRPTDEVRGQIRYGSESSWTREHHVGRDIAGVDVTLILGLDLEDSVILGLDAALWDPLPMGISFYAKALEVERAREVGWHVWEKVNRGGTKRSEARSPTHLETVVAFRPERLLDYARLERRATSLRLDPALRFAAASLLAEPDGASDVRPRHVLEKQFELSSEQILNIIGGRNRLSVAVRGGVAEHHLERYLEEHEAVAIVQRLDADAKHDFDVVMASRETVRIECKNASPKVSARGDYKVEVQKTRASKGDPASRFYAAEAFDVVAACLFSATGRWEFRFARTSALTRHKIFADRLAPIQVIGPGWVSDIASLASV